MIEQMLVFAFVLIAAIYVIRHVRKTLLHGEKEAKCEGCAINEAMAGKNSQIGKSTNGQMGKFADL